ncbi:barrier-to-autointegration factor-like protein isoform X1 [Acanthopagrus latus]|uniref:barrier-to-autointegration factor-like protein isoform X1 n=2 Tax=Acanthopagrus latus TaxID=8177 RepID=UPI00187BF0A0|nr:barrier-to-autointegration factor-like protein isoform X1 [Acanthopagrus latus]
MRLVFPGFRIKRISSEKNSPSRLLGGLRCLLSSAREAGPVHLQQAQTSSRMSNTSQKHRDFVGEPMGDKPVSALAGIGEILGKKLEHQGFDKAYVVLGQFLLLKKDGEMFTEWLKDASGANSRQAGLCALCLKEWCDAFL